MVGAALVAAAAPCITRRGSLSSSDSLASLGSMSPQHETAGSSAPVFETKIVDSSYFERGKSVESFAVEPAVPVDVPVASSNVVPAGAAEAPPTDFQG